MHRCRRRFPGDGFDAEVAEMKSAYPFLDARMALPPPPRLYGTRPGTLLGLARSNADLGRGFGADLYEAEVRYLVKETNGPSRRGCTVRRTKRGLHLGRVQAAALDEFMRGISRRHVAAAE